MSDEFAIQPRTNPKPRVVAVSDFFKQQVPAKQRTVWNPRAEPSPQAPWMDVDRIHMIFSDAEAGNVQDLFALYRDILLSDNHIQTELGKRKLALLGDPLNVLPKDKTNADDVAARAFVDAQLDQTPNWLRVCAHLLDGLLWPLAVLEKVFEPTPAGFRIRQLVPVPHQLLDYRLGRLMIRLTDPLTGYPNGEIVEPDPARYIIHRGHLLSTSDNWGGPFRSLVFWWYFGALNRDSWARFIDRFASPFMVGKYDQGDDTSRVILERAFQSAAKLFGLVISKETEVELVQAATSQNGDAFEQFHNVAQREKSKLILGQTLSAEAQPTGLGSGVAGLQGEVRQDLRQFDALMLATTLRDQLLTQLLRINGLPGVPPTLAWGGETPMAVASLGDLLGKLQQAGLQVSDASLPALSERLGFEVVRAAQPATPASVPFSVVPYSVAPTSYAHRAEGAMDSIARGGAADLARAFGGIFAPVRRMILESGSAEELERRLQAFSARWDPGSARQLLDEALNAFAANGTLVTDR